MKPLTSELQDEESLRKLGSASVQVVHDLKNQLNGLKLYATLLGKRLEKSGAPAEDIETVNKLAAGIDRAATDMNLLVRLGRPTRLRPRPHTDLAQILKGACAGAAVEIAPGTYEGEFDPALLAEALRALVEDTSTGEGADTATTLRRDDTGGQPHAVVERRGAAHNGEGDPFDSFAGGGGLRLALAAKVIRAHGGEVSHERDTLRARLPLNNA